MEYDVIVVGAGPAGATAAKYLAEQKIKVLLLDKDIFPRDKPCGGALPMKVVKAFPYLKKSDVINTYSNDGSFYYGTLKDPITIHSEEPLIALIFRKEFDHELVQKAIDSGAILLEGKTATDVAIDKEKVTITLHDGSIVDAKIVIGADGALSTIAQKTGLSKNRHPVYPCVFEECPMTSDLATKFLDGRNLIHILYGFEHIKGYGWLFPKKSHINIGIVEFAHTDDSLKQKKNLRDLYTQFVATLKENGILPKEYKIGKLRGGALPSYPLEKTYDDRVLLVGDAAGFINPVSGAGLYYAMTSGMIAASVAAQALHVDTSARFLSKYQDMFWKHDCGKELKFMFRVSERWGDKIEQFFNVVACDKKLAQLGGKVLTGQIENREIRGKLILRFIYAYIKSLFRRKRT